MKAIDGILNRVARACSPDMGAPEPSEDILAHGTAKDCKEPMGWTSENVANDFGISREEMDHWAAL